MEILSVYLDVVCLITLKIMTLNKEFTSKFEYKISKTFCLARGVCKMCCIINNNTGTLRNISTVKYQKIFFLHTPFIFFKKRQKLKVTSKSGIYFDDLFITLTEYRETCNQDMGKNW